MTKVFCIGNGESRKDLDLNKLTGMFNSATKNLSELKDT